MKLFNKSVQVSDEPFSQQISKIFLELPISITFSKNILKFAAPFSATFHYKHTLMQYAEIFFFSCKN